MSIRIIDGKGIAAEITEKLKEEVDNLKRKGINPGLVVVLVGENPASEVYVRNKSVACERVGIYSETRRLPVETTTEELVSLIGELNQRKDIQGILVQLPLPSQIEERMVFSSLSPLKDVDGFSPVSLGMMLWGHPTFIPCTPAGILELLWRSGVDPKGKRTVIVGRSRIVGLPLANLLALKREGGNATVTLCHSLTPDLSSITREADILVSALGRPQFIKGEMIKEGAVVIDVGINRVEDPGAKRGYRLVGDVEFESAQKKASVITPVPGGVGPMTVAMLLKNTVQAARWNLSRK
jgi:methylenetetrahydrofolate dehydrogenase (NADP+)/methenyltetrahydrofolate cyclohydrolase